VLFSPQIPLPLEPRRDSDFDGFVGGPNQAVVSAIRHLRAEPVVSLFLQGAESSGKTHLLHAACHASRESGLTAFYAGLRTVPADAWSTLEGLEDMDLVCIDDLEQRAGAAAWEEALFHLYNRLRDRGGKLLLSSRMRLSAMPIELPDLRSRLASGLRLRLEALDEDDMRAVLEQHALSIGVELPEDVGRYLLSRGHRSLVTLVRAVERLQQAAFAGKRRITVPLAREVLRH
jgi:DnaA family protein